MAIVITRWKCVQEAKYDGCVGAVGVSGCGSKETEIIAKQKRSHSKE